MDLYEQNYILMRLLAPQLRTLRSREYTSRVDQCLPLYMTVVEKEKFTTTVCLTYRFTRTNRYPKQPDLFIRVYHDSKSAEVISGLIHGVKHNARITRKLESSWEANRFLYKWLRYCLHRGHQF